MVPVVVRPDDFRDRAGSDVDVVLCQDLSDVLLHVDRPAFVFDGVGDGRRKVLPVLADAEVEEDLSALVFDKKAECWSCQVLLAFVVGSEEGANRQF